MQPNDFIRKWKAIDLSERAAAQSHFIDLCALVGEANPTDADPTGEWYCFEKGAVKTTNRPGWADVWKKDCFGWEYKKKRRNLNEAFVQLQQYAIALQNPPLLVVSDIDKIEIHTNWTNSVGKVYEYALDDLRDANVRDELKCIWSDPNKLKPETTRAELTERAAGEFAALAQKLRQLGYGPEAVAHFINRLVFCMFAESAGLLPASMFKRMLEQARRQPDKFSFLGSNLFRAMKEGGWIGFEQVDWFNGGLFDDDAAIPLDPDDLALVQRAATLNWSEIDTSIFGTLFERGLDPDKRSQLGAHYTDREKIQLIVEPVITQPWLEEWAKIKATLATLAAPLTARFRRTDQPSLAAPVYNSFLARLRAFRILDPACGSGNFLYVALLALKDIENQVLIEGEALGFERQFPYIGPEAVLGIEVNPYAAELARVTVWIGEIQWMRRNGFDVSRNPILKPLETIECRDAILNRDGTEADWPDASVIIGNPPFLGGKLLRTRLTGGEVDRLFGAFRGRVPAEADLVCYWFAKAWEKVRVGHVARVGFVSTNAIRGAANGHVLNLIATEGAIFNAWSDEPWVVEGAAVRVAIICFGITTNIPDVAILNGELVSKINADLTGGALDLTQVQRLEETRDVAFMGDTKGGAFDIPGELARTWLSLPINPNGRSNAEVLRPWVNGEDITGRASGKWIVDFGWEMDESAASLFEAPYRYIAEKVKPERQGNAREAYRRYWWRHVEPRPGMWKKLSALKRYIVTPEAAKHRFFVWLAHPIVPDHQLQVIAREDDTTFGILHSRFHLAWVRALGSPYGNHPTARRYNITRVFRTFPFPDGLALNRAAGFYASDPRSVAIAEVAQRLDDLRNNWLNPPNATAEALKGRTLTDLYNDLPTWLLALHRDLDQAVAAAYGWPVDISDEDALAALLELNRTRVLAEEQRVTPRPRTARQLREQPELGPALLTGGRETPPIPIQRGEPLPLPRPRAAPTRRRRS